MRNLLSLSVFTLLISMPSFAGPPACVGTGGILSVITIDDVEYKTVCCPNLVVENHGSDEVCFKKDESVLDPTLASCSSDSDCSSGKGCFVSDADDHFSGPTNSDAEENSQDIAAEQLEDYIDSILGDEGDEKDNGQGCTYHAECDGYNCEAKKAGNRYVKTCTERKICRLGQGGDIAIAPVQCEEGLVKDQQNKCISLTDGVYAGIVQDTDLETDNTDMCKMNVPSDLQFAGQSAIKQMRAMEFLFANSSSPDTDCLRSIEVLKGKIGTPLLNARIGIVQNFNAGWSQIKKDYQTLMAAQAADATSTNQVQVHGASISEGQLKTRTASGFDMLIMMKRRNELFSEFESKMLEATKAASVEAAKLGNSFRGFDEGSKSWGYEGGSHYSKGDVSCRPWLLSKGKKRKVKRRMSHNYKVKGHRDNNYKNMKADIVFMATLSAMGGNADSDLGKRKYFLMDPLIPYPKDFNSYGNGYGLTRTKYNRKLNADNKDSLLQIRNDMQDAIFRHLSKLNPSNKSDFLYEPELVQITDGEVNKQAENSCLSAAKIDTAECSNMKKFIADLSSVSTAQSWAYGRHSKRKYKDFFGSDNTWRNRLFKFYGEQYLNLVHYYETLSQYREKQNLCIDQRLGLVTSTMAEGGYVAGLSNNYWDPNKYLEEMKSGTPKSSTTRSNLSVNHNFSGFDGSTNAFQNGGSLKDNIAGSNMPGADSSASVNSATDAAFAANVKRMQEANKKVSASELAEKSKGIMDSMKTIAKGSGAATAAGAGPGSGSSSASLGAGFGNSSGAFGGAGANGAAALGKDLKGDADKNGEGKATSGIAGGSTSGSGVAGGSAGGAGFASGLGGISAGSGNGMTSGDASAGGAGYQDPTGMSDEEKDRLLANYQRTKSQYDPKEDDSLFKVVSKAYVRNLEKVLTKKKKTLDNK